jgi:hypothetical protein
VLFPFILALLAGASAAVLAYGTDPGWAQFSHGIDFILWSRRLQWPLIAITLVLCLVLLTLIISGKRRAWWLLALSPILALFIHRFATDPDRKMLVVEDPALVDATQASFIGNEDWVVGVRFGEIAYAFPLSALFHAPVILLSDREKRMVLMWSPFANRAMAYEVTRDFSARDLEVVSTPANAVLLYNSKLGQFINAVTGRTPRGEEPTDFRQAIVTVKTTWARWNQAHPECRVMAPLDGEWSTAPGQPILPRYPIPAVKAELPDERRLCFIATARPMAVPSEAINGLLNLTVGRNSVLLFRDSTGQVRAFDRHIDEDLSPRFARAIDPKHPEVALVDADTNTEWSITGTAMEGQKEMIGKKLTPLPVEDELYWDVMKFWYPDLQWVDAAALSAAMEAPILARSAANRPAAKKRRTVHSVN